MRRLVVCLALALLVGPAHLPGLQYCPTKEGIAVYEYRDFRVRFTFLDVLYSTGMDSRDFALCEDSYTLIPQIKELPTTPGHSVFAMMLPHQAKSYSDTGLRGLIAHEFGHLRLWGRAKGVDLEIAVDRIAAGWVGPQTVIAGLRTLLLELDRFSETRDLSQAELDLRIGKLGGRRRAAQQQ